MENHIFVSIIMILATILGLVSNSVVLYRAHALKEKYVKQIVQVKSISNILTSIIYPTYICIMLLGDVPFLGTYSRIIGLTTMALYQSSNINSLFFAINRLVFAFFHQKYESMFTSRRTWFILGLISVVSCAYCLSLNEILSCNFSYDIEKWSFLFAGTCSPAVRHIDLGLSIGTSIAALMLNLSSLFRKRLQKEGMVSQTKEIVKEKKFIRISIIQNCNVIACQFFFYFLSPMIEPDSPVTFSLVSNYWALAPAAEGIAILLTDRIHEFIIKTDRKHRAIAPEHRVLELGEPVVKVSITARTARPDRMVQDVEAEPKVSVIEPRPLVQDQIHRQVEMGLIGREALYMVREALN